MKTKQQETSYRFELRQYLKQLSQMVERELPPGPTRHGKCRFALVIVDDGRVHYASNSHRGMITALRRVADRIARKHSADRIFTPRKAVRLEYT